MNSILLHWSTKYTKMGPLTFSAHPNDKPLKINDRRENPPPKTECNLQNVRLAEREGAKHSQPSGSSVIGTNRTCFLSVSYTRSSTSQKSMPSFHVGFASARVRDFFGSLQKAHSLSVECKCHTGANCLSPFYRASLLPVRTPRVTSAARSACLCTPTSQHGDSLWYILCSRVLDCRQLFPTCLV